MKLGQLLNTPNSCIIDKIRVPKNTKFELNSIERDTNYVTIINDELGQLHSTRQEVSLLLKPFAYEDGDNRQIVYTIYNNKRYTMSIEVSNMLNIKDEEIRQLRKKLNI